jgi:hypothetical protein
MLTVGPRCLKRNRVKAVAGDFSGFSRRSGVVITEKFYAKWDRAQEDILGGTSRPLGITK